MYRNIIVYPSVLFYINLLRFYRSLEMCTMRLISGSLLSKFHRQTTGGVI